MMILVCCIIKPPAVVRADQICEQLLEKGIVIREVRQVIYTQALVDVLYDHMDSEARSMITCRYGGRIGAALLIEARSIAASRKIIGTESDPRACAACTIRAEFGLRSAPESFGAWPWWENAMHRPVDERERLRDIRLIFPEHAESAGY